MSSLINYIKDTATDQDIDDITRTSITAAAMACYEDAYSKGFHQGEIIGSPTKDQINQAVAKLHAEVSEFWEAARKSLGGPIPDSKIQGLNIVEEELADIIIGAFETAVTFGVDIGKAFLKKADYNSTRPDLNGKNF